MNDLDKKVGEAQGENKNANVENKPSTGVGGKRKDNSAGPLKTRACGAMALQRRMKVQKGRQLSSNFASIDRSKYFDTHLKNKSVIPPIGAYRNKYGYVDPKTRCPLYGTQATWGN